MQEKEEEADPEEARRFRMGTWAWVGVAATSVVGYLYFTGLGRALLELIAFQLEQYQETEEDDDDYAEDDEDYNDDVLLDDEDDLGDADVEEDGVDDME